MSERHFTCNQVACLQIQYSSTARNPLPLHLCVPMCAHVHYLSFEDILYIVDTCTPPKGSKGTPGRQ